MGSTQRWQPVQWTDAIIRSHPATGRSPRDTARAFEEIGEIDLAIDWAEAGHRLGRGHQSLKAAGYWCKLLAGHRPAEVLWNPVRLPSAKVPSPLRPHRLGGLANTTELSESDQLVADGLVLSMPPSSARKS